MRYSYQSLVIIATLTFVAGVFCGLAIDQGNQLLNPTPTMDLSDPGVKELSPGELIAIGDATLLIKTLDSDKERAQGLSGLSSLPEDEAYFFVFDSADLHGIWMKEMFFPIDIVWLDEEYKVVHIEHSVAPETFPEVFRPATPALYVLEMNAGVAKDNNIQVGTMAKLLD